VSIPDRRAIRGLSDSVVRLNDGDQLRMAGEAVAKSWPCDFVWVVIPPGLGRPLFDRLPEVLQEVFDDEQAS
jgi:hypothetical protein